MALKKDEIPSFSLNNTNSAFSTKSKDIFAGLEALEQKHNACQKVHSSRDDDLQRDGIMKQDPIEEDSNKRSHHRDNITRDCYRDFNNTGRVSQVGNRSSERRDSDTEFSRRRHPRNDFRKPRNFAPRAKKIPDFKKNPENWTCYSLEDVSESDMSEKSNKRAALDFLFERKNEREKQERINAGLPAEEEKFESSVAACSKGMITFSRSKNKHGSSNSTRNSDCERNCDEVKESSFKNSHGLNDEISHKSNIMIDNSEVDNDKVSLHDVDTDTICEEKQSVESGIPIFKARKKSVKKQIRQKMSFDVGDDEGEN